MTFEAFFRSYCETAVWSSTDDNDKPLDDNHDADDIHPSALKSMRADCQDFYDSFRSLWEGWMPDELAGHNFWLTRNRHGAGFWDSGLPTDIGKKLTDMSHPYGESYLYIGDDSMIYVS